MITWTPGTKLYDLERKIYRASNMRNGGSKKLIAKELGVSLTTAYMKCHQFNLMGKKKSGGRK